MTMEQSKKTKKEKKFPRVPIKTYKWEDIRRARKKGGYPWTYLYKQPFNEHIDPDPYKMSITLPKSKSSSAFDRSERVQISEVTEKETSETKVDSLQIVTEPDDRSARNSIGSLVIEECELSDVDKEVESPKFDIIGLESADSSDNISQYLDKEERGPQLKEEPEENAPTEQMEEEAKETEQASRKRKMSAESSYSRISSTKDAVLKKLKETKNKIKVPKLSFPVKKLKTPVQKSKTSTPESKKESKKQSSQSSSQQKKKNGKPVYIHIPLKPPPGETDEFSYLEFGETPPPTKTEPPQLVGSFKLLAKNIKRLQEAGPTEEAISEEPSSKNLKTDDTVKNDTQQEDELENDREVVEKNEESLQQKKEAELSSDNTLLDQGAVKKAPGDEEVVESSNQTLLKIAVEETTVPVSTDKEAESSDEIVKKSDQTLQKIAAEETTITVTTVKEAESSEEIVKNTDQTLLKEAVDETTITVSDEAAEEPSKESDDTAVAGAEDSSDSKGILKKPTEISDNASSSTPQPQKGILKNRKERAKSEENERKRKLSLESSYSRKSLSKLEFMKKLRETTDKIKRTFSETFSFNKEKKPEVAPVKEPKEKKADKSKKQVKPEAVKPVYIYIPLKSTEGEDQPEEETRDPSNSPETPSTNDVQFIILTAPSDDEVLDGHSSDVPDTPSSDHRFFEGKVEELKKLAKDAANDVTNHKLDTVTEENGKDSTPSTPEPKVETLPEEQLEGKEGKQPLEPEETPAVKIVEEPKEKTEEQTKMKIDVEDGLSESLLPPKEEKKEQPIEQPKPKAEEATVKTEEPKVEPPPVVKKKVSFRRRSKVPKDDSYEEITPQVLAKVAGEEEKKKNVDEIVAPTVELNAEKICAKENAGESPREDEDEWSKASDHEYEPVNPPAEVQTVFSTVTVNIIDDSATTQPQNQHQDIPVIRTDAPIDKVIFRIDPMSFPQTESTADLSIPSSQSDEKQPGQDVEDDHSRDPSKFQQAWKQTTDQLKHKTDQFKSKWKNMKKPRPQVEQEDKPKTRKFKFEKPKFNLPKMPDKSKINLPSLPNFSLPRRNSTKRSLKARQLSTESNTGDAPSSKKITFDFSTYPRVFKKFKHKSEPKKEEFLDLASSQRSSQPESKSWSGSDSVRVPLHSEESFSDENFGKVGREEEEDRSRYFEEDQAESRIRYGEDIDNDDAFDSQDINNEEYLNRWNRGNFNAEPEQQYRKRYEVTDLDSPDDFEQQRFDYNSNQNKERYSSGSSFGGPRIPGVLEEINPDEFFLRRKGISQDNIEMGLYLSSEIKEAFKTPENALSRMEQPDFNLDDSNQSLPETPSKRKPIKKPKRKKTPHVSQERISPSAETDEEDEDLGVDPPSRPKRRSKRISKSKHPEHVIPYQETIPVERATPEDDADGNILGNFERYLEENDGFPQRDLKTTDLDDTNLEFINDDLVEKPAAPPRKHKSLKSLVSESDSFLDEIHSQILTPGDENGTNRSETDFSAAPPPYPLQRPTRKKSRSSLQSRTSLQSKELPPKDEEYLSSSSQLFSYDDNNQTPCVEEPCAKTICDYMGYAVVDKQQIRDPPLPPPRTLARKKRSAQTAESNFFTVPRQSRYDAEVPVRPLRNYSTLTQAQARKVVSESPTYENKENIDIVQYIEDESNRNLQSGDVIRKMKDRPLPAPPRPPRKSRALQNITSKENIMTELSESQDIPQQDQFCEGESKTVAAVEKRLITPDYFTHQETITHGSLLIQSLDGDKIVQDSELSHRSQERIVPVSLESDDETSSVPEEFKKLRDPPPVAPIRLVQSPGSQEIDVLKAHKLQVVDLDVDTLTVNKLLAGRIIVSEIDSRSIMAEEIHSKKTQQFETESDAGGGEFAGQKKTSTQSNELETQPLVEATPSRLSVDPLDEDQTEYLAEEDVQCSEKEPPVPPPRSATVKKLEESFPIQRSLEELEGYLEQSQPDDEEEQMENASPVAELEEIDPTNSEPVPCLEESEPLQPPQMYRQDLDEESLLSSTQHLSSPPQVPVEASVRSSGVALPLEPEVDDEPPPRPPQPHPEYFPSQPPASFYALRAQRYVDGAEHIPKPPRRKRRPRSVSRSSSEDSVGGPPSRRYYTRSPEPSVGQLSGQLARAVGTAADAALRRLISDVTNYLRKNSDGKLDLHVMTIILLVLVAGLILLGHGDEKTVVHMHHWEFFNPPRDM